MTQPALNDAQVTELYFDICAGKPINNESARALLSDRELYAGLYYELKNQWEREKRYEYEPSI